MRGGVRFGECASCRNIRAGGIDAEELPMPEIKCCQYFSSREKWAHVLSAPVFPTSGMMRWRL